MSRRNTRTSVPYWLVRNRKPPKIHTNHLRFHFYTTKLLSIVNTNNTTNHLRHNNHITQVCLDTPGLLSRSSFLLCLSKTFDESHWFAFETAGHTATGTGGDKLHELFIGEVEELVEFDSAECEFAECALFT